MSVAVICALCIVCTVLSLTLKKHNPEIALIISVAAGIIIAFALLEEVVPVLSQVRSLMNISSLNDEYTKILFKALGICFLCEFASSSCEDAGEKALSQKIQLAGKISIVILSLPMLEIVAKTAITLIEG